jgi:predicted ATPase/DNA-binding XRE family transcriptional regulator
MPEHQPPAFADLLRRARRAAGLSQGELAEHAGLSARAISDLERGVNRAPRRDTLDMLAEALALSADERRLWERARRQHAARPDELSMVRRDDRPTNLQAQPNRFFGRVEEIEQITRLLRHDGTRLLTLTGPGGSGKTRLAVEVAATLLEDFPDGVYFVDLAPVSDPTLVLPVTATTLGVRLRGDQSAASVLGARLRGRRLLLVLDNLEQVLSAAREIGDLLQTCGDLRVLATSRAPLRLRAERELPVLPMPVLPAGTAGSAQALADSDAVQLFVDRARAVRASFTAVGDDLLVIAQICERLDGLPLAIELAAAGIRILPPHAILARLEQHLPLPVGSTRDAPSRQQTLQATIGWSYERLGPAEQSLLRRLSIFRGGWMLEAAEAVAGDDPLAAGSSSVVQGLATLVEHSLVQSAEWLDGSPRFSMLETIRAFGLERLVALLEADGVHRRHAGYLIRLFTGAVHRISGPSGPAFLLRGDAERENVRAALDWAIAHDPITALRLAHEFSWNWFQRGANHEALRWLERALAAADAADEVPDALRAGVLSNIGMHATSCGAYALARASTDQSLTLFRALGDQVEVSRCLFSLGRIEMWAGDQAQAVALYEASAELSRQFDDDLLPTTLMNLGNVHIARGDLDAAAIVLDDALEQADRFADVAARALTLVGQSEVAMLRGDLPGARQLLDAGLRMHRELQDPRYLAQGIESAAWLAALSGDAERTARLLGAAGRIRDTIGVPVPPKIQTEYDHYVPIARAQIDPDTWDQAMRDGQSLSTSAALDDALAGLA